jgi:hypothetical protein
MILKALELIDDLLLLLLIMIDLLSLSLCLKN